MKNDFTLLRKLLTLLECFQTIILNQKIHISFPFNRNKSNTEIVSPQRLNEISMLIGILLIVEKLHNRYVISFRMSFCIKITFFEINNQNMIDFRSLIKSYLTATSIYCFMDFLPIFMHLGFDKCKCFFRSKRIENLNHIWLRKFDKLAKPKKLF